MKLDVPFFRQHTNYSCGPASLKMVLQYYGIHKSEDELYTMTKLTEDGTVHGRMIRAANKCGLHVFVDKNTSIDALKYHIDEGTPVIVNFLEPKYDEGHYAVVIGYDHGNIILNDPLHGAEFRISFHDFESRWRGEFETAKRWMMAVSNMPFDTGRQYYPAHY